MIQELINTFEELKKYEYFINIGKKGYIIINFENSHFYHLAGFHKLKLDIYFPKKCTSKEKKYKYIKSHPDKFENILKNQLSQNNLVKQRIENFKYIPDLLNGDNTILYSLREKTNPMSLYDGDFALMKIYQLDETNNVDIVYCLLGLKKTMFQNNTYNCAPQSWMVDKRPNNLVQYKKPLYIKEFAKLPLTMTDLQNTSLNV